MHKKHSTAWSMPVGYPHKIWLIMRLTTVILIATIMQVSASGFGQKVSVDRSNASLESVINEIRNQCNYNFIATAELLDKAKPVTITVKNMELIRVLELIFRDQSIGYSIEKNTVILTEKAKAAIDILTAAFQIISVRGKVVDSSGNPLAGATVLIHGTDRVVRTDLNGAFHLENVDEHAKLTISFVGYKTIQVHVLPDLGVLKMSFDDNKLDQVIVNAGYYSVTDKERTGSISRVTSKDIEKQPVSNPLAAMQGRMAGVNISQAAGTPGSGFTIQIRGINSLRSEGNDPLFVVDGVPYATQSLRNNDLSGGNFSAMSSPISTLNPADIESIEVLKDADATAIYGSRGANGVVLITTRKGKPGRTKVDLQSYTTMGKITGKMRLLNLQQYLEMRREAFENDGITTYPADAYDINGGWDQQRYTDWQRELIGGTSHVNNVQLGVSGGSATTQFLLAGTYRNETTVFPGKNRFIRGGVTASIKHKSTDERFSLSLTANFTNDDNALPNVDLTRFAYQLPPDAPALYDTNGKLNWENGSFENPLSFLNGKYKNKAQTLLTNVSLSYKLPYGFDFRTSLGFTDSKLDEKREFPYTMHNPTYNFTSEQSELLVNNGRRQSWIIEPQLTWQRKWKEIGINVLAGTTFQAQQQEILSIDGYGFPADGLMNSLMAASTVTILQDNQSEYKYNAVFGRFNLNAGDRYIFNLTGRRDGSSRFGTEKRFANFGAIGGAWIFSQEPFLQKIKRIVSFGKLRASYGLTGNDQIGDYQYFDTYQITSNNYDGIVGVQPSRLFNPDFGWETNKKLEVALQLGVLNERISVVAAWFRNLSSNQLIGVTLPGITGFSSIQANLGATVENTGWEFEWRSVNVKSSKFSWVTNFNVTVPQNRLTSFPDLQSSTYRNNYIIGQSINLRRLYQYKGVNPQTGLYEVADINNDGVISVADDLASFVDFTPDYYGGMDNQLTYGKWSFDFLFQFTKQKGTDISSTFTIPGSMSNQPAQLIERFVKNESPAHFQLYSTGADYNAIRAYSNFIASDAITQDASFLRLKTISLAYSLSSLLSKTISGKIYLQAQNILTFTKYNGADPENRSGVFLPPLKQLTLGLQLNF